MISLDIFRRVHYLQASVGRRLHLVRRALPSNQSDPVSVVKNYLQSLFGPRALQFILKEAAKRSLINADDISRYSLNDLDVFGEGERTGGASSRPETPVATGLSVTHEEETELAPIYDAQSVTQVRIRLKDRHESSDDSSTEEIQYSSYHLGFSKRSRNHIFMTNEPEWLLGASSVGPTSLDNAEAKDNADLGVESEDTSPVLDSAISQAENDPEL